MVRTLAVLVFAFALVSAFGLSASTAQEKDKKEKTGTVIGELKSRKDINNGKGAVLEILAPGEEKARAYYVSVDPKADPKARESFAELLKTVKTANAGDRVQIDWHRPENAEGNFFVAAFKVLKKADAKNDDGKEQK